MGLSKTDAGGEPPEFGAAADGDADRNMILGKRQLTNAILSESTDVEWVYHSHL